MKKLLSLLIVAGMAFTVTSCGDDDGGTPVAPTVAGPTAVTDVQVGTSVDLSFTVATPGGYKSAAASSGDISSEPDAGATTGTVVVAYTAGTTTGAASVNLTVTDNSDQSSVGTAVLNVTAEPVTPVVVVRGDVDANTTWSASNIYQLDTRVTVLDGVTLTIEPGTVIKGNEGQGAAATALLVARGGTLNAVGTAALPIVFTSILDPIDPKDIAAGDFASTTSESQAGLWGGLIVLGKANITAKLEDEDGNLIEDNLTELQIEGIPSSDTNGLYGGTSDTDNSGTISYVSIRHGGINIGAGNEINGLTVGGVGSGTTINNIEVVANADDGIEFFGGSVAVDKVVIWNSFDDSLDTDQDFNGTVTNFIIVTPNTGSAFELDGPEGSRTRGMDHIISEGVIYGGPDIDKIVDWDGSTNASLQNLYFFGIEAGVVESFGGVGTNSNSDTDNWETDLADNTAGYFDGVTGGVITYGVGVASKSYGPSASDFAWTWAGNSGALADLGL